MVIIDKLKREYKRFINKQFLKINGNYNSDHLISDSADEWKLFYIKNYSQMDNYFERLFKNLDEESIRQARLIFDRNVFLHPWRKIKTCYLYNLDCIYEDFEKEAQKQTVNKDKYKLPEGSFYQESIFYYKNGLSFVPDSVKDYLIDKDFLDCGAYSGDSALVLNEYNPNKIYCFEPGAKNLKLLNQTIKINNLGNKIIPVPMGVGEKQEKLCFSAKSEKFVAQNDNTDDCESLEVTSIDNFISKNKLNPGIIKMDIEGAEYAAIKGALETIKKHEPVLLISIYHTPIDFFEIKPLIEKIVDYKFIIRKIEPDFLCTDLILIGYPKRLEK